MVKSSSHLQWSLVTALFLIAFSSDPAIAAPVTLPTGQVINLTAAQVELLKQNPSIFFFEHRPQKLITGNIRHWTLLEIPEEIGGGFLIGTDKNMDLGLAAVGAVEGPDVKTPPAESYPATIQLYSESRLHDDRKTKEASVKNWRWSFNAGYRNDELNWSIAGITPTIDLIPPLQGNYVNILSELSWDNLEIFQMEFGLERRFHRNYKIRGTLAYGVIFDGDNQDSDYAGNNRTFEFSRSNNDADDGKTWDASIGFGWDFFFLGDAIGLSPLIGFSYHTQQLKMNDGVQTISAFGWLTPLGPFPGLNSTYDAQWYGPWIGLELTLGKNIKYNKTSSYEFLFGIEYHWAEYDAEANWNLRPDFAHPKSFEHDADGSGIVYLAGFSYFFDHQWSLNISGKYQDWETDPGKDRVFFADGTTIDTRLNEVEWESFSLSVGVSCRF